MTRPVKFLIIDGYTREAREELIAGGASLAADLYVRMLETCSPTVVSTEVFFPSDVEFAERSRAELSAYDGIAWTGCSLSLCDQESSRVQAQVEIARTAFDLGIPSFGSCWAAQIAVVAAGGRVKAHPHGREMGIARKIHLTREGREHPLYDGKPPVFDAFTSHDDEIVDLPPGGVVLAGNAWTRVQSVSVRHGAGEFWGLQYHPEYDLHELARLTFCRLAKLTRLGFFPDREAGLRYIDELETLYEDPSRRDIAWRLGIDDDVMNAEIRQVEVRNWIEKRVLSDS